MRRDVLIRTVPSTGDRSCIEGPEMLTVVRALAVEYQFELSEIVRHLAEGHSLWMGCERYRLRCGVSAEIRGKLTDRRNP